MVTRSLPRPTPRSSPTWWASTTSGNLEEAVASALRDVQGAYGIAVICADEPDVLVAARNGSPLLVGVGEKEWFVASDASAILEHTRSVVYLDDGEMVVLNAERVPGPQPVQGADRQAGQPDRVGPGHDRAGRLLDHFMLKEIFEQPESVANTLRGHLLEEEGNSWVRGLNLGDDLVKSFNRVVITACGTSWHAGLIGEYMIEEMGRLPVEVEYASRVPLPESGARRADAGHRDLAVGRDRGHPGRGARSQAARRPGRGPGERGRAAPSRAR